MCRTLHIQIGASHRTPSNSRCCCRGNATHSWRNRNNFSLHFIQEVSKVIFKETLSCSMHIRHLTQFSSHRIRLHACYRCVHFIWHTLVKNVCVTDRKTILLVSCTVGVKNIKIYVAFVVFHHYSSICYSSVTL